VAPSYCDPPYWGTEGYGVGFGVNQYDRMVELLRSIQGKAIVSANDIPEMRLAFKGLTMLRLAIRYSVGASGRGRGEKGELLIRNS
jgi:DNA adenine methylase